MDLKSDNEKYRKYYRHVLEIVGLDNKSSFGQNDSNDTETEGPSTDEDEAAIKDLIVSKKKRKGKELGRMPSEKVDFGCLLSGQTSIASRIDNRSHEEVFLFYFHILYFLFYNDKKDYK